MIKLLQNKIFSVKQIYDMGFTKFKIKVLGVKLSFKIKNKKIYIDGKNNKIYLKENGNLQESYKVIPNLYIEIKGDNNTVIIDKDCEFYNSFIYCSGNSNEIIIDKSIIYNSTVNFNDDYNNRKIHIKENVSTCGVKFNGWGSNSKIIIGKGSILSYGINIMTGDSHFIFNNLTNEYLHNNENGFCEIGEHVWMGMNNTICKNVKISNNSIIGAGSVVTKSFDEENCVIAGNPAKIVKRNINWKM